MASGQEVDFSARHFASHVGDITNLCVTNRYTPDRGRVAAHMRPPRALTRRCARVGGSRWEVIL